MNRKSIVIVEDEESLAGAIKITCERAGWKAEVFFSGQAALKYLADHHADLVVLDIGLPDMNGLDLFSALRTVEQRQPVLIITAHGNLSNAVESRRLGAAEYLVKPFDLEELTDALKRLLPQSSKDEESEPAVSVGNEDTILIGAAVAMQDVYRQVAHACMGDVPVLITGPTGTGKTLCARAIHLNSERRNAPFVNLHCSALPEELLESELFGHEKNAFTGAVSPRAGHVERAAGGTLLLDEIADIPLATQAKLLRFVEEKVFHRVGGREDLQVDLRLITATNKDLKREVKEGRFREDLFYRLQVLEIALPALKQRKEDIPALCQYFLGCIDQGNRVQISDATWEALTGYDWPGNVRQLKNVIERAAAVCPGKKILPQHLPVEVTGGLEQGDTVSLADSINCWLNTYWQEDVTYEQLHDALERELLQQLLMRYDNKPSCMANELKMNRTTLLNKRKRMELG